MEWKQITKDELLQLIESNTYVSIGKMFGISDNAVKKKAKRFDIWKRKKVYNGHNDHLKKPSGKCLWCGGDTKRRRYDFCSVQCFKTYEHHIYINKWKLGLETGAKSNGFNLSRYIHTYLRNKYDNKCSRCGWNTPNPFIDRVILEVEHIDGDCTNNKEDNLDLICPNCHSLTSTYRALNKGNGNRDRLEYHKLR